MAERRRRTATEGREGTGRGRPGDGTLAGLQITSVALMELGDAASDSIPLGTMSYVASPVDSSCR